MLSEEGLASFNKDNSANFSGKWKWNEAFQGIYLTRNVQKILSQHPDKCSRSCPQI